MEAWRRNEGVSTLRCHHLPAPMMAMVTQENDRNAPVDTSRSPGGTYFFFFFGELSSIEICLLLDARRPPPSDPAALPDVLRINFSYFFTVSGQPRLSHFRIASLMSIADFTRSFSAWHMDTFQNPETEDRSRIALLGPQIHV